MKEYDCGEYYELGEHLLLSCETVEVVKEVPVSAEYPEYDPNKEYAVYERFQYNGVVAECRKCSSPLLCRDCVLYPCNGVSIKACKCMASSREDGVSVYYKVLTDVRP